MNKRQKKKQQKNQQNPKKKQQQKKQSGFKQQQKPVAALQQEQLPVSKGEQTKERKEDSKAKTGKKIPLFGTFYFACSLILMEFVMAFSTGGKVLNHYGVYIICFSIGYGLILQVITTLTSKERVNQIFQGGCLFILALLFCIIYFLHREFQVFYNLSTMLAGALDAMDDFSGDIAGMVFTLNGMVHVILFFLPFILYLIFQKRLLIAKHTGWKKKGVLLGIAVFVYLINLLTIQLTDTDKNMYSKEYHYDSATIHFGVMTGLRLDVKQAMVTDQEEASFVMEDTGDSLTEDMAEVQESTENQPEETSSHEEIQEPLGKNELDIDFDALAKEDGGKYAAIDEYVASLEATSKNEYTGLFEGKNLIFFTAEAFSAEVIDKDLTPTLYRLANKGIQFTDFYQPAGAGTTGGEYGNLFGMLATSGGESVKKTATHYNWSTIASRLTEKGYYGKAYHNNDYTYYDRDKTHINLGYSDGFEGVGNGMEDIITSQWPESDLEMIKGTLPTYIDKEPFNIYYMTVSGHSLYSFSKNAMSKKHQEQVKDLDYSETVKAYIACQLEFEDALTYLVDELEKRDLADDTVIVISPDHFPYGLGQSYGANSNLAELYGRSVDNDFIRDHNRLIIWSGCLEKEDPIVVDTPVTSMDILPTLCNLFGTDFDSRLLPGRDVFSEALPLAFTLSYDWKTDKGTYIASKGTFTPKNTNEKVSDEYIENVKAIVKNKITYSRSVLNQDYFRHVFGKEGED